MRTWDDVKYLYYNIAMRYIKYYPEYEVDELVNEAWIMTAPYINIEGSKLPHRMHSVIQAYIKKQKKYCLINVPLNEYIPGDESFEEVDNVDFIMSVGKQLNHHEKILLCLRFQYGLSLRKIGQLFNLTNQAICYRLQNILRKMKI